MIAARSSRIHRAPLIGIARLVTIACILVIAGIACNNAAPVIPTVPPLTSPPPATPTPPETSRAEPSEPAPSPLLVATPFPPPTLASTEIPVRPSVSQSVVARTAEQTADLTDRMLQPRLVDAEFLWGMFITNRSFVGGWARTPDPDYTTRMLEMWHSNNPCYAALEVEAANLAHRNSLPPLEFLQYVDHVIAQLSPCVDDQLNSIDGAQFFDNSMDIRTQRINTWFDRSWEDADDGTFAFDADCQPSFYSHLPAAVAATDSAHLESAWASAMVVVSGCARDAMQNYFEFLDISESQLKELRPDDRYATMSLQMTMFGHLFSINLGKPSDECWPDYASHIPKVAATDDPDEMIAARNVALKSFQTCLENTPTINPFSGQ